MRCPKEIEVLCYAENTCLDQMIGLVKEWESKIRKFRFNDNFNNHRFNNSNNNQNSNKNNITCYSCGQKGHISTFCSNRKDDRNNKRNLMIQENNCDDILRKIVDLNGHKVDCVMDSGSSVNIVTENLLERIGFNGERKSCKNVSLTFLNGSSLEGNCKVSLKLWLDGVFRTLDFYVISRGIEDIILSNSSIRSFYQSKFPIECPIWHKKIKSYHGLDRFTIFRIKKIFRN